MNMGEKADKRVPVKIDDSVNQQNFISVSGDGKAVFYLKFIKEPTRKLELYRYDFAEKTKLFDSPVYFLHAPEQKQILVWKDSETSDEKTSMKATSSAVAYPYYANKKYDYFVIDENGTVTATIKNASCALCIPQCVLDIRKPFAPELKELVDYKYSINLPFALGIRALYPETGLFKRLGQVLSEGNSGREISWDELICAIGQFQPDFINEKVWHISPQCAIDLKRICKLRDLSSWQNYMRAISFGRKRASLNEVDFFDIQFVWKSYCQWLDDAKRKIAELTWHQENGSISIVFQIGSTKITAVYSALNSKNRFKIEKESTFLKNHANNHSVAVYIDYFCTDIISSAYQHDCFVSAIPLFEGMSAESESLIVDKITEQYETIGFERIPEDPVKIRFKTHFLEKESSEEWRAYVELMQNRQNDFKYSQIYTIETDLKTICEFEIMNNMKIGVRYRSPFSIVVMDLVKDKDERMFGFERILPAVPSGAVVCVPIYNGKYVLLKQFRHTLRTFQYGFPRGFGELGLSPEQNAKKELFEELGCHVIKTEDLGEIVADSGLSGNRVRALLCEISTPKLNAEHEGIVSFELVSPEQLRQMISDNKINDGFTLAAYGILNK